MLERVLVANRGEIARRVLRTCRRLGVSTVAVYSDADVHEPHRSEADTAVRIGPGPAPASYLDVDALLDAAVRTGCDAVHPGYGFLAEDAGFARRVGEAGLVFVGPTPEVIALMGDKAAAKRRLAAAGVPVIPGEDDASLDDAALIAAGQELGAPLVVKAVAGGGGTGMRVVHELDELADALVSARREARGAFGDDRVILERLVARPRHIEVQVLADHHGAVIHLLERECSVQRRHQKLVEEAPSPVVDDALRNRLGDAAVTAAAAVGYRGAGTLEFLVDGTTLGAEEPTFAFLEMNTRLQVEHPVTELVTGLDLVELQLRVAAGEHLPLTQEQVRCDGHAIEVRLYAEDPVEQLPQTGTVTALRLPEGPGVRTDVGIASGSEVTRFYDPMLGKLIAHGPDRASAISRLRAALATTVVHGVVTNRELLDAILAHPAFAAGELTTAFLPEHLAGWRPPPLSDAEVAAAARALHADGVASSAADPWARLGAVRTGGGGGWPVTLRDRAAVPPAARTVHLRRTPGRPPGPDGLQATVESTRLPTSPDTPQQPHTEVVRRADGARQVWLSSDGRTRLLEEVPPVRHADATAPTAAATFTSPMPGTVIAVEVTEGQEVTAGTTLVLVEAMKMEHPVRAPVAGVVTALHVRTGQAVEAGATLLTFDPSS